MLYLICPQYDNLICQCAGGLICDFFCLVHQSSGAAVFVAGGQEGTPVDRETGRTRNASVLQKEETQRGLPEKTGISAVPGENCCGPVVEKCEIRKEFK